MVISIHNIRPSGNPRRGFSPRKFPRHGFPLPLLTKADDNDILHIDKDSCQNDKESCHEEGSTCLSPSGSP